MTNVDKRFFRSIPNINVRAHLIIPSFTAHFYQTRNHNRISLDMFSFDQIVFETVFAFLLLLIICYNLSRWSMYRAAAKIPGEDGLPLIGRVPQILFGGNNTNIFEILHRALETYGSPTKIWYGNMLCIYVEKPEQIQVILNSDSCLQKTYLYKFLGVNYGLIASDGK